VKPFPSFLLGMLAGAVAVGVPLILAERTEAPTDATLTQWVCSDTTPDAVSRCLHEAADEIAADPRPVEATLTLIRRK
jgi:hypothetical protein